MIHKIGEAMSGILEYNPSVIQKIEPFLYPLVFPDNEEAHQQLLVRLMN